MEGLIIFLIIGILSAIFNKDKKKPKTSMPPFDQNKKPKEQGNSLEDFAKEIFQQLSGNTETSHEETKNEKKLESIPNVDIQREGRNVHSQPVRQPIHTEIKAEHSQRKPIQSNEMKNKTNQMNNQPKLGLVSSKKDLVNAIIAQEILGPPKAKQR